MRLKRRKWRRSSLVTNSANVCTQQKTALTRLHVSAVLIYKEKGGWDGISMPDLHKVKPLGTVYYASGKIHRLDELEHHIYHPLRFHPLLQQ